MKNLNILKVKKNTNYWKILVNFCPSVRVCFWRVTAPRLSSQYHMWPNCLQSTVIKWQSNSHGYLLDLGEFYEEPNRRLDNSGEYLADIYNKEFWQMSQAGFIRIHNILIYNILWFMQRFSLVIVSLAVIDMIVGIIIPINTLRKGR